MQELNEFQLASFKLGLLKTYQDPLLKTLLSTFGVTQTVAQLKDWRESQIGGLLSELQTLPELAYGKKNKILDRLDVLSEKLQSLEINELLEYQASEDIKCLFPDMAQWPKGFESLEFAPFCLWYRGDIGVMESDKAPVSFVGARASTEYGEWVTTKFATELADRGHCVISGGAYGIDAAAHRSARGTVGNTVAFLAGGVDDFYPRGNYGLLKSIVNYGGAVCSELPPGSKPLRHRFLQRNRLIAAASYGLVVVEAGWRSGALSSAHFALEIGRPVGVVPGPITSGSSLGCVKLLRNKETVCVCHTEHIIEMLAPMEISLGLVESETKQDEQVRRPTDELDEQQMLVLDSLGTRKPKSSDAISMLTNLAIGKVLAILGYLEFKELVANHEAGWVRIC